MESHNRIDDGDLRLWMSALAMSVALNGLVVTAIALRVFAPFLLASRIPDEATARPKERVATIMPDWKPAQNAEKQSVEKRFTRTSPDQSAPKPPENAAFEGERDTIATSDRAAMIDAPELPSQEGIDPRDDQDFETTESNFTDGKLDPANQPEATAMATTAATPAADQPVAPPDPTPSPSVPAEPVALPPQREKAFQGPDPIEVAAQPDQKSQEDIKQPEQTPPHPEVQESKRMPVEQTPHPPAKVDDPAFSGFQRKTAIVGSISRTGRSALDVEDSPMGRYQAAISRAVELEWQRNCVRHRDFITPGFLTVRFFVEPSGKVRSVQFVGDMETGEVQKGFTLNSIRDAPIPRMPDSVRKEQDGSPLELVFRFYF